MELRHHWQIRIWYHSLAGEEKGGLEEKIEMSPSSVTAAALWSHNTGPLWLSCQLFQTYPQQHWVLFEFSMGPLYFSPFTHDVSLSVFYPTLCSIWLHGDAFVSLPHPVRKGQAVTKRRWGCMWSFHRTLELPFVFLVLIRQLYVFTYTPLRLIMFTTHVAEPEVRKLQDAS